MNVTRPVILDLWPAYASGEASADTRALVEAFLRADPEFAAQLQRDPLAGLEPPSLPPDVEMRALTNARRRLTGYRPLLLLAMVFTSLAFGRTLSDTSWDVSPLNFSATATVAAAFWISSCPASHDRDRAQEPIRRTGRRTSGARVR